MAMLFIVIIRKLKQQDFTILENIEYSISRRPILQQAFKIRLNPSQ